MHAHFAKEIVMHTALKYAGALSSCAALIVTIAFAADQSVKSTPDKYTLKVPGGLAFAEFRGYESWEVISVSQTEPALAVILGNPAMINAYKSGIPGNGKPFPDGAKMAKIHWDPKKNVAQPGGPVQPSTQRDIDFMVKDSKRFADGGGWGYAFFKYDAASGSFAPVGSGANCGTACHTVAKANDYVFSEYATR
jgi:hypothetical protein